MHPYTGQGWSGNEMGTNMEVVLRQTDTVSFHLKLKNSNHFWRWIWQHCELGSWLMRQSFSYAPIRFLQESKDRCCSRTGMALLSLDVGSKFEEETMLHNCKKIKWTLNYNFELWNQEKISLEFDLKGPNVLWSVPRKFFLHLERRSLPTPSRLMKAWRHTLMPSGDFRSEWWAQGGGRFFV